MDASCSCCACRHLLSFLFCRKSGDYALKLAKLSASKRRLIAGSWSRNDQNFVRGGLWREKDYCAGLMLSVIFCKRLTVNLLSSDRLHHTKCSMTGSGSEASTPLAASCPPNPSLNFQTVFAGSNDIVSTASCHIVASDCLRVPSADENGVPVVKASTISTPLSSDAHHDSAAPSAPADVKKVVPTAADVLASAVQIKRDHPGCGVKKVLLEMQQRHPDWAITEHRVNKLLHENGLANVKKPSNVTSNTDDMLSMPPQQQQSDLAVPDIHFDILSLPQPHAVPDELWPKPPSPLLNSAPHEQPANAIHLSSFKPESGASSAGCTGDASDSATIAALECSNSIDLGKLFGTAAADACSTEAPSVV